MATAKNGAKKTAPKTTTKAIAVAEEKIVTEEKSSKPTIHRRFGNR